MKHIYFVRHGLSVLNEAGLRSGSTETPLTLDGREQAKRAAQEAEGLNIDYILTSTLSRAYDTAVIIAAEIGYPVDKIDVSELTVERHFGPMEGKPWQPNVSFDGVEGVETSEHLIERARQTVKYLESLDVNTVLVVSHGSFGRALRHVLNPEIPFDGSGGLENAKIVKLL